MLDVVHERTAESLPLDQVEVVLQMEMRGQSTSRPVLAKLRERGYDVTVF